MRRVLPVVLVWIFVAGRSGPVTGAEARATTEWPVFRGNPQQTGVAASPLPDQLDVRWTFQAKDAFEGTAAIAGGTVYAGCYDEFLYAIDLATGKEKWRYKATPFKVAAAVRAGTVYIGDVDGGFHCVDAATGKRRWKFDADAEITSGASFAGDTVLFGSGDENLYCLTLDGQKKWQFKVPGGPVLATPAVAGGQTFVSGCDSTLHVIDLATGKEAASAVNLDGQTGATPAVVGDFLYVGTMTNQVLGINWKKGEIAWHYEPARHAQPFFASAAVTDALVIAGGRDKLVHTLDRASGKEVWNYATRGKIESSPVVVGDRVFVGSMDGHLYELALADGKERKQYRLGKSIAASPAVAERCLVIGTQDGALYCLGEKK